MQLEVKLLLAAAACFLTLIAIRGYSASRDPLHPTIFLAPLFLFGMVIEPLQCLSHHDFANYFPSAKPVATAMFIQYLGIVAFFVGIVGVRGPRFARQEGMDMLDRKLTHAHRRQLRTLAWIIAGFALFGFWSGIHNSGGFVVVYSRAKGVVNSWSGYFGEAQNLGIAALIIYALGCQRRRLLLRDALAGIIMASPLLIQGTFGGRRGPLFLGLVAIYASFWIARAKLPRPRAVVVAMTLIVGCVVFVSSQRAHVYIGSTHNIQVDRFLEILFANDIGPGDNFMVSTGTVIVSSSRGEFHYGRRFLINFIIRPIPRQLWSNKYEDATLFLYGVPYREFQAQSYNWESVLGWRPLNGYATNVVVDLWIEFWWGYLVALWGLGAFIGVAWRNFRNRGGYWFVVYVSVAALSIYLPTQSLTAFLYRLLYLSLMTLVFWRVYLGRQEFKAATIGEYGSGAGIIRLRSSTSTE